MSQNAALPSFVVSQSVVTFFFKLSQEVFSALYQIYLIVKLPVITLLRTRGPYLQNTLDVLCETCKVGSVYWSCPDKFSAATI